MHLASKCKSVSFWMRSRGILSHPSDRERWKNREACVECLLNSVNNDYSSWCLGANWTFPPFTLCFLSLFHPCRHLQVLSIEITLPKRLISKIRSRRSALRLRTKAVDYLQSQDVVLVVRHNDVALLPEGNVNGVRCWLKFLFSIFSQPNAT
jgi:hypothetical protein